MKKKETNFYGLSNFEWLYLKWFKAGEKRGYQKGWHTRDKSLTKKYYKNLTECARLEKQMKYGVRIEEDPEGSYGQTGLKKRGEIK